METNNELQKEWEARLRREGLGKAHLQEKVPVEAAGPQSTEELEKDPEMAALILKYEEIPAEIQQDILTDIKKQRAEGKNYEQVLARLNLLLEKGEEMLKLTEEDSDKTSKGPRSPEQQKIDRETADIPNQVDKLIQSLEEILKKKEPPSKPN